MIMPDHDAVVVITKTDYGKRGMRRKRCSMILWSASFKTQNNEALRRKRIKGYDRFGIRP